LWCQYSGTLHVPCARQSGLSPSPKRKGATADATGTAHVALASWQGRNDPREREEFRRVQMIDRAASTSIGKTTREGLHRARMKCRW
jgi:hypothetical protein